MKKLILKDHIGNVYRKIYEDFKPYKFRLMVRLLLPELHSVMLSMETMQ